MIKLTSHQAYLSNIFEAISIFYKRANRGKSWVDFAKTYIEDLVNISSKEKDIFESELKEPDLNGEGQKLPVLQSIFARLGKEAVQNQKGDAKPTVKIQNSAYFFLPTKPEFGEESEKESFFPKDEPTEKEIETAYQKLWKEFEKKLKLLRYSANSETLSFAMFQLLSVYLSRMACSNPILEPDVSLFDEFKTKACQSSCDAHEEFGSNPDHPYLLIKGDLSGIQGFIYSEIDMSEAGNTSGLSKRLRGRSFYIALLTEIIADYFTNNLGLTQSNVLYSGGGHFLMVAPNSENINASLKEMIRKVNLFLFYRIGGRIELVVGQSECNRELFQNTSEHYQAMSSNLSKNKFLKHKSYLKEIFYPEQEKSLKVNFKDDEYMGRNLPKAEFIIEVRTKEKIEDTIQSSKELVSVFEFDGLYRYIFMPQTKNLEESKSRSGEVKKVDLVDYLNGIIIKSYGHKIQNLIIHGLNHTDFVDAAAITNEKYPMLPISFGYFLIGTKAPVEKKVLKKKNGTEEKWDVMDFERIAELNYLNGKDSTETLSFKRLGVMRLDIDNLGNLFAVGLGKKTSFARVSTLSRELHFFFSGHVNSLADRWGMYVTYSGGDDAFVVSSWLNTLHFAKEFQQAFRDFVCGNLQITLSGGVFMCSPHYPVAKFAKKAENAEDSAKAYKIMVNNDQKEYYDDEGDPISDKHKEKNERAIFLEKNAISAFDHTLSWDTYPEMLTFSKTILGFIKEAGKEDAIEQQRISRSVIHRVLRLIKGSITEDGQLIAKRLYRNTAQFHYLLSKQGFTEKEINDHKNKLAKNVINLFLTQFKQKNIKKNLIADFIIPTNYVILKTRKIK